MADVAAQLDAGQRVYRPRVGSQFELDDDVSFARDDGTGDLQRWPRGGDVDQPAVLLEVAHRPIDPGDLIGLAADASLQTGRRIVLEVKTATEQAGIQLAGTVTFVGDVRHGDSTSGPTFVGVELVDMTPLARDVLEAVLLRQNG